MATTKQKTAARRNLAKARDARSAQAKGAPKKRSPRLSTAAQNDLPESAFAFPKARKEPLTDARHVRNAIARFDQVEGVSDAERDRAWKRIKSAAKKFDVEVSESGWRELFEGGKAKKK
jgi:hypothetical protein